ncbi:chemotaxis protein CheC [Rhodoferax sp.]|uniref:chemotaxis protein CheC n=1 Tax=Rhodoferax sp. TaxID=50421 RepID=UPI00283ADCFD|nr:chemotaxis protein CheC [Rhodoferax sp.]MDR3369647.1 chemotaxis protein CheC [Rhodoferax sp.]
MNLTDIELDALTEVFNVGVGQAAGALSQLAGSPVQLKVPLVAMISKQNISDDLQAKGTERICAVRQNFSGVLNTEAVLMFPVQQSLQLVQMMVGGDVPLEQLGEMEQEAMAEIGNILLNSVVSGIADVLRLRFEGSLPQVEMGPVRDVLCAGGPIDELVLSLQIDFAIDAQDIQGYLVFLLDVESVASLKSTVSAFLESLL